jgi:protein-disulfide isomerase
MKKMTKTAFTAILLAEWVITGYFIYQEFRSLAQISPQNKDICSALFLGDCDAVFRHSVLVFGLSWAIWGWLYFTLLLTLFGLAYFLKSVFEREAYITSFLLMIFAGGVSLFLSGSMLLGFASFCGVCAIIHTLHFGLIYLFWWIYPLAASGIFKAIQNTFRYLLLGKATNPASARIVVVVFLMLIFMNIAFYQRLSFELKLLKFYTRQNALSDNALDNFFAQKSVDIPVNNSDAQIGTANAPVEIILFSDFECPYCAEFALEAQKWLKEYPEQIRLIFKHYPLSNACNPETEENIHPNACEAALASQAALRQDKFWEFHDALFTAGFKEDNYQFMIQKLQLNPEKFNKDRQSLAIIQKVKADIQLANQLGISGTPTVFLNKRKVENLHPELLKKMIEKILKSSH